MKKHFIIITGLTLCVSLNACVAATIFTAAEAGKTLAQERSTGSRLDDNGIAIAINEKFVQKDFEGLFGRVDTNISEGRVLLAGAVDTPTLKKEAERLVWEVEGVKEVINEIQVNNSTDFATYMEDAYITRHIKAQMLLTKGISSVNYGVETVDGTVYLMGIAKSQKELDIAIAISRRAPGVKKVVSHVIFRDDPRRGVWSEPKK